MEEKMKKSSRQGYLLIALAGALWGTGGFFVTRLSQMGAPTELISFCGHFFTLVPFIVLLLFRDGVDGLKISKKGLAMAAVMGIVGKAFFLLAYNKSITLVGASTASVLIYLSPIFTSILSFVFLGDRLRGSQVVALGLNLLGSVLVVTGGNFQELNVSVLGIVLGVLAALFYAMNTILGKLGTTDDDPITLTFYMLVFSSLVLLPLAQPWNHHDLLFSWDFLKYSLTNSFFGNFIANIVYFQGLSMNVEASKASVVASIEIVVANLIAVFVLGENLNVVAVLGILILLGSIVLMNSQKAKSRT